MCGYFLNATSDNPVLMTGYMIHPENSTVGDALIMRTLPLTSILDYTPLYGTGSYAFKHLRNSIMDAFIVSASDGTAASAYQNFTPVALECVMSWCVRTIRSSYDSGVYSEEILDTVVNATAGSVPWVATHYETETGNNTDVWYREDINIDLQIGDSENNHQIFGCDNTTTVRLMAGFTDAFPSQTTASNVSATPLFRYKTWQAETTWTRVLDFNPWLAPNNVTRHMERFAMALSNQIRSQEGNATFISGYSYAREIFIHVRWEWLVFPMILLLLSFIFLLATIVKTSKDRACWKTSAMPTLIFSLPQDVQSRLDPSSTWSSANNDSKKMRVRLLSNNGWRISGHSQLGTSPKLPPHIN